MSEFLFFYPNDYFDASTFQRAFFARRGRIPTATEVRLEPYSTTRTLARFSTTTNVSGSFYVPCVDRRRGLFFASTETLPPSFPPSRPRPLLLELARGQLSRLLKKRGDWTSSGLRIPTSLRSSIRRDTTRFAALATSDFDSEARDSDSKSTFEAIRDDAERLNDLFLERALDSRQATGGSWETALGFATSPSSTFFESVWGRRGASRSDRSRRRGLGTIFQTFNPALSWADVETEEGRYDWTAFDAALDWAKARGMRTTVGPLFRWERRSTPRWLWGRPNENEETVAAFRRFVDAVLRRDAGRTARWIVAANVEKDGFGSPSEVRFELAEETGRKIGRANPDAESFLGFEQPLGDAARFRRRAAISPIEFAAKIARRRTFDGFYLELNFGLSRRATAPRDPMEWHRFFDQWAAFGTRLSVAASYPSAEPVANASVETFSSSLVDSTWTRWFGRAKNVGKRGETSASDLLTAAPEERRAVAENVWSEKTQQENVRQFLSAALARRSVGEVIWTRLFDVPIGSEEDDDESSETTAFDLDDSRPDDAPPFVLREGNDFDDDSDDGEFNGSDFDDAADETTRKAPSREKKAKTSETKAIAESGEAFEPFSTSGLIGLDGKPKPAFHKLAALKRAYFD